MSLYSGFAAVFGIKTKPIKNAVVFAADYAVNTYIVDPYNVLFGTKGTKGAKAPTVKIIRSADGTLRAGMVEQLIFELSEAGTNFTINDIKWTGGKLENFIRLTDKIYVADFTPTPGSTASAKISIAAKEFKSAASNMKNKASESLSIPVDTVAPTAWVSNVPINNTGNAVLRSTEVGTAYLVHSSVGVGNLTNITGAADNLWNSVAITRANSNTYLSAAGLVDGSYKVYTTDAAGNLSAMATNLVTLDSTAPTVTITRSDKNNKTLGLGSVEKLTFTLSETSYDFGLKAIKVEGGWLSDFKGSGTTYTATFKPTSFNDAGATISIAGSMFKDATGNQNIVSTSLSIPVDTVPPNVQMALSNPIWFGESSTLTLTFSKVPQGFTADNLTTTGLKLGKLTKISEKIYTIQITPTTDSIAVTIGIAEKVFTDAVGNGNGGGGLQGLIVLPKLTTTQVSYLKPREVARLAADHLKAVDASGHTVAADLTNEQIKWVSLAAIQDSTIEVVRALGLGNLSPLQRANLSDTVVGHLTPEEAMLADSAGHKLYMDLLELAPAKIQYLSDEVIGSLGINDLRDNEHALMKALSHAQRGHFSKEVVHALTIAEAHIVDAKGHHLHQDLSTELVGELNGAVVNDFRKSELLNKEANGEDLLQKLTPGQARQLNADMLTEFSYYDFQETIANNQTLVQALATTALPVLNGHQSVKLTFVFKELFGELRENEFVVLDLNGNPTDKAGDIEPGTFTKIPGTEFNYSVVFKPNSDVPDAQIRVGFKSSSLTADALVTVNVDTVAPKVVITVDNYGLGIGQTAQVTFTFSEVPKNFTLNDVQADGGTLSDLRRVNGSELVYTATLTPDANRRADGEISIKTGAFTDAADNGNLAAESETIHVDTALPTIHIHSDNVTLRNEHTVAHLTITLSDSIPGARDAWQARNYLAQALTSDHGTFSNIQDGIGGRTFTADFTLPTQRRGAAPVTEISINVAAGLIKAGVYGNEATTLKLSATTKALFLENANNGLGASMDGAARDDGFGDSLAWAGDVNGDGFSDLIFGVKDAAEGAGKSYVVFGDGSITTRNQLALDLAALEAGTGNGFVINGAQAGDHSGFAVAGAGDVNDDGFDDLVIGAPDANNGSGAAYVVFGKKDTTAVELAQLAQPAEGSSPLGYVIEGAAGQHLGYSVAGAGDVNRDGLDDVVVGGNVAVQGRRNLALSKEERVEFEALKARWKSENPDGGELQFFDDRLGLFWLRDGAPQPDELILGDVADETLHSDDTTRANLDIPSYELRELKNMIEGRSQVKREIDRLLLQQEKVMEDFLTQQYLLQRQELFMNPLEDEVVTLYQAAVSISNDPNFPSEWRQSLWQVGEMLRGVANGEISARQMQTTIGGGTGGWTMDCGRRGHSCWRRPIRRP